MRHKNFLYNNLVGIRLLYKIYRCRPVSESVERGFMHSEADLRLRKICEEKKRGIGCELEMLIL